MIVLDGIYHQPYYEDEPSHEMELCRRLLEDVKRRDTERLGKDRSAYASTVLFFYGCNGGQIWPEGAAVSYVVGGEDDPVLEVFSVEDD
jgi:hypothetical protein